MVLFKKEGVSGKLRLGKLSDGGSTQGSWLCSFVRIEIPGHSRLLLSKVKPKYADIFGQQRVFIYYRGPMQKNYVARPLRESFGTKITVF